MRRLAPALTLCAALLLAACDSAPDPAGGVEVPEEQAPAPVAAASPSDSAEPVQPALPDAFRSRDCATVAQAYSDALNAKDFVLATRAWESGVTTEDLALRYAKYGAPVLKIGQAKQEGTAGSLYCNLTVILRDGDDPQLPLRQGSMTLRRANEVPGASADQLRWRITDSTLEEQMPRTYSDVAPQP